MRTRLLPLLPALLLFACSSPRTAGSTEPTPAAPISAEASLKMEAVDVVEAWFAAVDARDAAGAAALGTTAWQQAEQSSPNSFTHALFLEGTRFESHSVVSTTAEAGQAKVRARAVMLRADGTTDTEGLRFTLERNAEGDVVIVDLN